MVTSRSYPEPRMFFPRYPFAYASSIASCTISACRAPRPPAASRFRLPALRHDPLLRHRERLAHGRVPAELLVRVRMAVQVVAEVGGQDEFHRLSSVYLPQAVEERR